MDEILALAKERGLRMIEDCAQRVGARHKGRTTGDQGGMLLTGSRELRENAWSYKNHDKRYATMFEREHQIGFLAMRVATS
jgi:dTDP-4-amino-4,6-dideoxygalactose transaminase